LPPHRTRRPGECASQAHIWTYSYIRVGLSKWGLKIGSTKNRQMQE
jgi:hypothetical protein